MKSMDCYRSLVRACLIAATIPALACGGCEDDDGGGTSADTIIIDGSIDEDRTLENIIEDPEIADYLVTARNIGVSGALTVEPGVRIAFESGTSFEFQTGSLTAIGTEEEPIVFTAANGQPGGWKGLYIKSSDVTNELTHCIVEYGGQDTQPGINEAVNVGIGGDSRIKITNTTIRGSLEYGLSTRDNTDLRGWENNTLTENGAAGANLEFNSVRFLDGASSFAGNEDDFVLVTSTNMEDDGTWPAIDAPYRMDDGKRFVVSAAWTLEPGVTIESGSDVTLEVAAGSLSAVGTADDPITFTGAAKEPGAWRILAIGTNDTANELSNCVVEYAGSDTLTGISEAAGVGLKADASASINDCTFRDNDGYAVWVESGATLEESGNTFENNSAGDIGIE